MRLVRAFLSVTIYAIGVLSSGPVSADCVILLHGLARTAKSMVVLKNAFLEHGYRVANINYPSRKKTIEELADKAIDKGLAECDIHSGEKVHIVTHSMGAILVRYYLSRHKIPELGRVVMLAPPNKGSELVDKLSWVPGIRLLNGPAFTELGTKPGGFIDRLGPADYPLGIIAGTRTVDPVLSLFLPNPDDGKVSVASTKLEGMTDFITVPASHTFIIRNKQAVQQAVIFIETGKFNHQKSEQSDPAGH